MRKSIPLILSLIFMATLSAHTSSYRDCRENLAEIDESLSLNLQIQQDLLQGVWQQKNAGELQQFIEFAPSGQVRLLEKQPGTRLYKSRQVNWTVELVNQDPILVLHDIQNAIVKRFLVEQTCQGIDLTNMATGVIRSFNYLPNSDKDRQNSHHSLTGEWVNTQPDITLTSLRDHTSGEETRIEKAIVRFHFRPDGTFDKVLSSRASDICIRESGRWEISQDGRHLMLHCKNAQGEEVTQIARIKYLEMDEMVLEQPLAAIGKRFASAEDNDLYFNKQ